MIIEGKSEVIAIKHPYMDLSMYVRIEDKEFLVECNQENSYRVSINGEKMQVRAPNLTALLFAFSSLSLQEINNGEAFKWCEEYDVRLWWNSRGYKHPELVASLEEHKATKEAQ